MARGTFRKEFFDSTPREPALEPDERKDRQHHADEDAAGLDARQTELVSVEDGAVMHPDVHR
jgi:hypothetical protein